MQLPLYALPASTALVAKAAILVYAWRSKVRSSATRLCLLFIACMTVQSVAEITIFVAGARGLTPLQHLAGRWWYGAIILGAGFLLHLAAVSAFHRDARNKILELGFSLIYAPVVFLEMLLWNTSLLVVGFQPMGYTITKIPGSYYFLVELQGMFYLPVTLALFACGARRRLSFTKQLRNKLLLVGFVPFASLTVVVLVLLHLGYHSFNVTVIGPIALMFFLITATYALHQYRLVDVSYYLPGSKVRRQKAEFYERVRQATSGLGDIRSANDLLNRVADLMHCRVALVGGPSTFVAVPEDDDLMVDDYTPSQFPREELEKIDRILAADELAEINPALYQLMKRYKVGAVVPLAIAGLPTHWLLLGERFQAQVYTSRDFKIVEVLFNRIATCFLDNILVLESYVSEAQADVVRFGEQLATARAEIELVKQKVAAIESANRGLRDENANRRRGALYVVEPKMVGTVLSGEMTLKEYLADREKQIVAAALRDFKSKPKAAALLGMPEADLDALIDRYRLNEKEAE